MIVPSVLILRLLEIVVNILWMEEEEGRVEGQVPYLSLSYRTRTVISRWSYSWSISSFIAHFTVLPTYESDASPSTVSHVQYLVYCILPQQSSIPRPPLTSSYQPSPNGHYQHAPVPMQPLRPNNVSIERMTITNWFYFSYRIHRVFIIPIIFNLSSLVPPLLVVPLPSLYTIVSSFYERSKIIYSFSRTNDWAIRTGESASLYHSHRHNSIQSILYFLRSLIDCLQYPSHLSSVQDVQLSDKQILRARFAQRGVILDKTERIGSGRYSKVMTAGLKNGTTVRRWGEGIDWEDKVAYGILYTYIHILISYRKVALITMGYQKTVELFEGWRDSGLIFFPCPCHCRIL